MSRTMTVDVVMGTYNGANFVSEQLRSILVQDRGASRVLVCDDGSTDATLEIVGRMASDAPIPVEIVRNPVNLGATANFLVNSRSSTADLVAFADQDDVWHPTKLARCVAEFERDPTVTSVNHAIRVIDAAGVPEGTVLPRRPRSLRIPQHRKDPWLASPGMAMVVRRDVLGWIDPHRVVRTNLVEPMMHDLMALAVATALGTIVYLPDTLADYRIHGTNQVFGRDLAPADTTSPEAQAAVIDAVIDWIVWMGEMGDEAEHGGDATAARNFAAQQEAWGRFVESLEYRRDLYATSSTVAAARMWLGGILSRRYRPRDRGGLGPRGAARDAVTIATGRR